MIFLNKISIVKIKFSIVWTDLKIGILRDKNIYYHSVQYCLIIYQLVIYLSFYRIYAYSVSNHRNLDFQANNIPNFCYKILRYPIVSNTSCIIVRLHELNNWTFSFLYSLLEKLKNLANQRCRQILYTLHSSWYVLIWR